MKKLVLFAAVISLVFMIACGGGGAPKTTGPAGFTNASFKGNYVFTLNGQCANCSSGTPIIKSVGMMIADGNGTITSGTWDLNIGGADQTTALTGTYTVNVDGTANLILNETGLGTSDTFSMMLSGTNGGYIVSSDTTWALAGVVEQQSTAAIATQPAGTFVFQTSGVTSSGAAWGLVGGMNLTTNVVTADMNNNGSAVNLATGTLATSFDSTTGRGTVTIVPVSGFPSSMDFAFYVVDGGTLELVSDDASSGMQGRAEATSTAIPSGSVLTGSFAFMGSGFLPNPSDTNLEATEGGIFTGDGAGNITAGTIDTVYNETGETGATFTATGSVTQVSGLTTSLTRDALTLTTTESPLVSTANMTVWLTSTGRGFFLTQQGDRVETGTLNVQSGAPYTDGGTFASSLTGWLTPSSTGTGSAAGLAYGMLFKNSGGTISAYNQVVNVVGSNPAVGTGTGTLTFDSTGTIGALTLNNSPLGGSVDYNFYQYSPSNAFIMQVDGGVIASGAMTAQTAQ